MSEPIAPLNDSLDTEVSRAAGPAAGADPNFLESWRSASKPRASKVPAAIEPAAVGAADARLRSRRRFTASVTLALVAVAASGFWRFGGERRSLASIADAEILPSEKIDYAALDNAFRLGKAGAIQAILQSAPTEQTATISRWIARSGEDSLLPLLVALLSNPVFEVRVRALTDLKSIPPAELRPHLPSLLALLPFENDEILRQKIERLIRSIQNA